MNDVAVPDVAISRRRAATGGGSSGRQRRRDPSCAFPSMAAAVPASNTPSTSFPAAEDGDLMLGDAEARVAIDPTSLEFIKGARIDSSTT